MTKLNPTKAELVAENKQLKEKLNKECSKERCYRCGGTGEIWSYWDGDISCPHCHGSGRV
jgi:DnaJ-class molecular chaperone